MHVSYTYWIVQTKYVGRVEERNPTRIDCVYHVGFRFALPIGVNLRNLEVLENHSGPLWLYEFPALQSRMKIK